MRKRLHEPNPFGGRVAVMEDPEPPPEPPAEPHPPQLPPDTDPEDEG